MLQGAVQDQPSDDLEADRAQLLEQAETLDSAGGLPDRKGFSLSVRQRLWAQYFVLTGGNSHKAAVLAEYSSPSTSAHKNLVNSAVMAEVRRLSVSNVQAFLPAAIRALVDICCNPEADARARVQAATALLDRGGMRPKSDGPAVQVNVQVNGQAAQAAIAEVWEAKLSREQRREHTDQIIDQRYEDGRITFHDRETDGRRHNGRKSSDIGMDMPDRTAQPESLFDDGDETSTAAPPGGGSSTGTPGSVLDHTYPLPRADGEKP